MNSVGLINFQRHPDRAAKYAGRRVRIWSGEHRAWWKRGDRGGGEGYTSHRARAGVWLFQDALALVDHAGPEKQICFDIARPGDTGETARRKADWHEDLGDVLWWKFPIQEAPWVGSPLCSTWPGYHTHWTPLPPIPHKPAPRRKVRS